LYVKHFDSTALSGGLALGIVSVKIIGKVIKFFMHKDLKLSFENHKMEGNTYYYSIRCENKIPYYVQLTKLYIKEPEEKALLEVGAYKTENYSTPIKYENIKKDPLNNEHTNTKLSPVDTREPRNYMMYEKTGILNNEASINIRFQGTKTILYLEYEILNLKPLKPSFLNRFRKNLRTIEEVIPI
jgi:hypothetical protein